MDNTSDAIIQKLQDSLQHQKMKVSQLFSQKIELNQKLKKLQQENKLLVQSIQSKNKQIENLKYLNKLNLQYKEQSMCWAGLNLSDYKVFGQLLNEQNHLNKITQINLESCQISSQGFIQLLSKSKEFRMLKKLNCSRNKICNAFPLLGSNLSHLTQLEIIQFSSNSITDKDLIQFIQRMHHNSKSISLTTMYLQYNRLSGQTFKYLQSNYNKLEHVVNLFLQNNEFSSSNIQKFMLSNKRLKFKILDFSKTNLSHFDFKNLSFLYDLEILIVTHCQINDEALINWLENFEMMPKIREVCLTQNLITNHGLDAILKFCHKFSCLKKINLQQNLINDKGIKEYSKLKTSYKIDF